MRRMRSGCCARPASGHVTAAPLTSVTNSRRLIGISEAKDTASYRLRLAF